MKARTIPGSGNLSKEFFLRTGAGWIVNRKRIKLIPLYPLKNKMLRYMLSERKICLTFKIYTILHGFLGSKK